MIKQSTFTKETSLDTITRIDPSLVFVLHRYNIPVDVSSKTIQTASEEAGIDPDFFTDILNIYFSKKTYR